MVKCVILEDSDNKYFHTITSAFLFNSKYAPNKLIITVKSYRKSTKECTRRDFCLESEEAKKLTGFLVNNYLAQAVL